MSLFRPNVSLAQAHQFLWGIFFLFGILDQNLFSQPALDPYQQYMIDRLNILDVGAMEQPNFGMAAAPKISEIPAMLAADEIRAWTWTGDEKKLDLALARLKLIVGLNGPFSGDWFFTVYPLTYCVDALTQGGKMDPVLREQIGTFIAHKLAPAEGNDLMNRSLLRACGFANAMKLWPDSDGVRGWKKYDDHIQEMLLGLHDVYENAPNYDRLDMVCIPLFEEVLGAEDNLMRPGFQDMYRRYRDQLAPSGGMAPYGDSGAATKNPAMPIDYDVAIMCAGFERAAKLYKDGTFRWAALKTFAVEKAGNVDGPKELFFLSLAHDWADTSIVPVAPVLTSQILMRPDMTGKSVFDKLILRAPAGPLTPFLSVDLLADGFHAHNFQRGALNYFELGDYPVVSGLGYNNRRPEDTNLFLVGSSDETFPFRDLQANKWGLAQIPLYPSQTVLPELALRVAAGKQGVTLWVSKVVITTDDGPQLITSFDNPKNWTQQIPPSLDTTDGNSSLKWNFPPGANLVSLKKLDIPLDAAKHPTLTFLWKLSNVDEQARPFIVRLPFDDGDYHAEDRFLDPTLIKATVEDRGDAHHGVIDYDRWFLADGHLKRQMLLFDDGTLIVADAFKSGPNEGLLGGAVWNPISNVVEGNGKQDFLIGPPEHVCSVYLSSNEDAEFGTQTTDVWMKKGHIGLYGHAPLTGKMLRFVSIFTSGSPKPDAKEPVVSYQDDGVSITLPSGRMISLKDTNGWDSGVPSVAFTPAGPNGSTLDSKAQTVSP